MSKHSITLTVNGESVTHEVEARTLLVHFIREQLGLTGTHSGCDTTSCGACRPTARRWRPSSRWLPTAIFIPSRRGSGRNTACSAATAPLG